MIRPATAKDLDAVYLMGYDAWGDGKPVEEYLASCRASRKYQSGTWYVLEEGGKLYSSLIVYRLDRENETAQGIGSLATPRAERRAGYATMLLAGILAVLDQTATTIYLHSEIKTDFYERHGFRRVPEAFQRNSGSVCMIRCSDARFAELMSSPVYRAPDYF